MKKLMQPIYISADINRVDDENRIVEGYAFVNEVVPGEGGVRLKRSAMEAATPDYMRWGAVDEMHNAHTAAGTATADGCGVKWDDKGAFFRCKVVDDQAWAKVKEGVYKAFSIGVSPTFMRGKDVEQCVWKTVSLVMRPKDKDAGFTAFRSDVEAEECEVDETEMERGEFASRMARREQSALTYSAFDVLQNYLWEIQEGNEGEARESLARAAVQEFADYICPIVARGEVPELVRSEQEDMITRSEHEQTVSSLTDQLQRSQAEADEVRTELESAKGRVSELERMKRNDPSPPVRFPKAIDREFLRQAREPEIQRGEEIQRRVTEIQEEAKTANEDGRLALVHELSSLKVEARMLGIDI